MNIDLYISFAVNVGVFPGSILAGWSPSNLQIESGLLHPGTYTHCVCEDYFR